MLMSVLTAFALVSAACGSSSDSASTDSGDSSSSDDSDSSGDGDAGGDREITVAIVGNPTMEDIQTLTPEHFTADTGITVNYVTLEEQTLREQVTVAAGSGGGQYDVVMIGPYEAPQFGQNEWLLSLTDYATNDADYDVDDLIDPIRNSLSIDNDMYAVPFYGESSFIMYNQEIMDAAGITVPAEPTWDEIAAIAREVNTDDVAGICLRGKPGWGDLGASLGTVVNTFGGTWWEANEDGTPGAAQINTDGGFREAVNFYVDLLNDAGEPDAANSSFTECLTLLQDGKVAMWYDATVAAGILESDGSPVQGKLGYALAPIRDTPASGWLWTWALAIPTGVNDADAAWEYLSWATSKEYIQLAGTELEGGWAGIPPGSRESTYAIPEYQEAASTFAETTLSAMNAAPIDNPGTTPRPGLPGVQYVNIPEFADVATRCTEELSAVIAGNQSVDDALDKCQAIAEEVSQ